MAVLDVTDAKLFSETIDRPTNEKKRKQHSEKKYSNERIIRHWSNWKFMLLIRFKVVLDWN